MSLAKKSRLVIKIKKNSRPAHWKSKEKKRIGKIKRERKGNFTARRRKKKKQKTKKTKKNKKKERHARALKKKAMFLPRRRKKAA